MGRVLYYHHYFPAAIFSSLLSGVVIDFLLTVLPQLFVPNLANSIFHWIYGSILAAVAYSFYLFAPLAYGIISEGDQVNNSTMEGLKWLDTWEF